MQRIEAWLEVLHQGRHAAFVRLQQAVRRPKPTKTQWLQWALDALAGRELRSGAPDEAAPLPTGA